MLNITAHVNGTRLLLSWQQPEGDLDSLVIKLAANGSAQRQSAVPPDATEVTVDRLTPGSLYKVVMVSRSGKLANQSESSFRTGRCLRLLCFCPEMLPS